MSLFWVFIKECRSLMRDKTSLFTFLVVPMILIGILGMALSNVFSSGESSQMELDPLAVFIVNQDEGPLGNQFLSQIIGTEELAEWFQQVEKKEEAELQIIIPTDFSKKVWEDSVEPIQLTFMTDDPSQTLVSVMEQFVEQFIRQVQMYTMLEEQMSTTAFALRDNDIDSVMQETQTGLGHQENIINKSVGEIEKPLSSFQYYSVAMGVMYLLFLSLSGTKALIEEKRQMTLQRLMITPQSMIQILLGKFLGWTVLGILQFLILVLGTHWLYGVDWGESLGKLLVLIICYSFAISSLGLLMSTIFHNEEVTDQVGSIGIMVMSALGGSMAPIYILPDMLNTIAKITPNAWALQTILSIVEGVNWSVIWLPNFTLLAIGVCSLSVGAIRIHKQLKT
jgi:ABC-2 type transport system permease protein